MMTANSHWVEALKTLNNKGEAYVLVTLLGVHGSAPRNSGSKMVVSRSGLFDTIGGGHLEYKATKIAQQMLAKGEQVQHIERFPLGPKLGQCCGGIINVLFESFAGTGINIMLFGAGHVGQAIAPILGALPVKLRWVDPREELFPAHQASNTKHLIADNPSDEVVGMPPDSYYLVLTHNHRLDYEICSAVLKRDDFTYLGLIGSKTKWQRFQRRFEHHGIKRQQLARISCPVGLSAIPGKLPMEVAISIVGEIISHYQSDIAPTANKQGIGWSELKSIITEQDYENPATDPVPTAKVRCQQRKLSANSKIMCNSEDKGTSNDNYAK